MEIRGFKLDSPSKLAVDTLITPEESSTFNKMQSQGTISSLYNFNISPTRISSEAIFCSSPSLKTVNLALFYSSSAIYLPISSTTSLTADTVSTKRIGNTFEIGATTYTRKPANALSR